MLIHNFVCYLLLFFSHSILNCDASTLYSSSSKVFDICLQYFAHFSHIHTLKPSEPARPHPLAYPLIPSQTQNYLLGDLIFLHLESIPIFSPEYSPKICHCMTSYFSAQILNVLKRIIIDTATLNIFIAEHPYFSYLHTCHCRPRNPHCHLRHVSLTCQSLPPDGIRPSLSQIMSSQAPFFQ